MAFPLSSTREGYVCIDLPSFQNSLIWCLDSLYSLCTKASGFTRAANRLLVPTSDPWVDRFALLLHSVSSEGSHLPGSRPSAASTFSRDRHGPHQGLSPHSLPCTKFLSQCFQDSLIQVFLLTLLLRLPAPKLFMCTYV